MTKDTQWAEDNEVPAWTSEAPRAAKIESVVRLDQFSNAGFAITLEGVPDATFEMPMDKWVALGCSIGGYLVFEAGADVAFKSALEWEGNHEPYEEQEP